MKLNTKVQDLEKVLSLLSKVVASKSTIPVLTHILVDGDSKLASGTDLNHSMQVALPGVSESGRTLIPLKQMQAVLANMAGDVALTVEGAGATLRAGKSRVKLNVMPPDNFPPLEKMPEVNQQIPLAKIQAMLARVSFAAHRQEGFGKLSVVLVEPDGNQTNAIATDGNRLALYSEVVQNVPRLLIGLASLEPLAALTGDTAKFAETETSMYFQAENALLIIRKINATFPDYKKVLPTVFKGKVTAQAGDLLHAIETAIPVLESDYEKVVLKVDPFADQLVVFGQSVTGESEVGIPVKAEGEVQEVGFKATYLLEFLRGVEGEITFSPSGPETAAEFQSGTSFRYIAMPLR